MSESKRSPRALLAVTDHPACLHAQSSFCPQFLKHSQEALQQTSWLPRWFVLITQAQPPKCFLSYTEMLLEMETTKRGLETGLLAADCSWLASI